MHPKWGTEWGTSVKAFLLGGLAVLLLVEAWPFALALFGGICFIAVLLRKPLGDRISRGGNLKIGKDGLTIDGAAERQDLASTRIEDLMQLAQNPIVVPVIEDLKVEFKDILPPDRDRVLLQALAASRVAIDFLHIYQTILNSQLFFLDGLAETAYTLEGAGKIHATAQETAGPREKGYPFESWVQFLANQALVVVDGVNVRITQKGRLFLAYLIHENWPRWKPQS